jgi:hypothetical protein
MSLEDRTFIGWTLFGTDAGRITSGVDATVPVHDAAPLRPPNASSPTAYSPSVKQAIAIGLSEARRKGRKVPRRPARTL